MVFIQLCLSDETNSKSVRESHLVKTISDHLLTLTDSVTLKIAKSLRNVIIDSSATVNTSIASMTHAGGGRHDNDFSNYRSVLIPPTIGELECKERSYLPTISDEGQKDDAFYLDRHFRLIREDVIDSIRGFYILYF